MVSRLKFTVHAQFRITDRNISVDHIRKAVREPDFTEVQKQGNIRVRVRVDDEREIEVIYYKESLKGSKDYLIITAYYLESKI